MQLVLERQKMQETGGQLDVVLQCSRDDLDLDKVEATHTFQEIEAFV